jgi:hypothetical protein
MAKVNNDVKGMDYSTFATMLYKHTWSASTDSYGGYIDSMREEHRLFNIAVANGPSFVCAFIGQQRSAARTQIHEARMDERKQAAQKIRELRVALDGNEFADFCEKVDNHDWYHDFSDDGSVRRGGAAVEAKLKAAAAEYGGLFEIYFDSVRQKVIDNIRSH